MRLRSSYIEAYSIPLQKILPPSGYSSHIYMNCLLTPKPGSGI
jgi:hypothetical protein